MLPRPPRGPRGPSPSRPPAQWGLGHRWGPSDPWDLRARPHRGTPARRPRPAGRGGVRAASQGPWPQQSHGLIGAMASTGPRPQRGHGLNGAPPRAPTRSPFTPMSPLKPGKPSSPCGVGEAELSSRGGGYWGFGGAMPCPQLHWGKGRFLPSHPCGPSALECRPRPGEREDSWGDPEHRGILPQFLLFSPQKMPFQQTPPCCRVSPPNVRH